MLQDRAAKERRSRSADLRSMLCGKLYDETGDRLTPSHSKTKAGKRLRYYLSHRLIANSGEQRDGWRLPAIELESQVATLIRKYVSASSFVASLMQDASADAIGSTKTRLVDWLLAAEPKPLLGTIKMITIEPGRLMVRLDRDVMAEILEVDTGFLKDDMLSIASIFQLRKRGVETKLVFADQPTGQDETLIRNIAKAHVWFEKIKAGQTFDQFAATEKTSKRRIQQMIELAFLAPDIIRDVLDGKQPVGLTSDWCLRHALPSDWTAQRELISTL